MNQKFAACLSFFFLLSAVSFAGVINKAKDEKIVYVDGVFDLAHYGHAKSFAKARAIAAKRFQIPESKVKILVGVSGTDEELKAYKRAPIFTSEQRVQQVMSLKGVDGVVPQSPMYLTDAFMNEEHIDLVMHGDDFTKEKIDKYYGPAVKRGVYASFPYEPGISTSAIIKRATMLTLQELLEKKELKPKQKEEIRDVIKLLM